MIISSYDLERPENYDALVPLVIPCWNEFYANLAAWVPKTARMVLELGCGTGILTEMIRKQVPECDIVCMDNNPGMLAIAKKKPGLEEVSFIEGDIRKEWPTGPFDAVATAQCLFRFGQEQRAVIAGKAFEGLIEGGVLINGDIFHPGNSWEFNSYTGHWRDFILKNGLSIDVADIMLSLLESMIKDYTIANFCENLNSAGFHQVAVPYRNELYAIVLGFR